MRGYLLNLLNTDMNRGEILEKKTLTNISKFFIAENIIFTTYFTTKNDPQRGISTEKNAFSYVENFYNSILRNNLSAVIFYDDLDKSFIEKYTCENIRFIQCRLGKYSLNDERFYIYYEFLKINNWVKKIILCDVNDVTIENKDVFKLIKKNRFYIGRDEEGLVYTNQWFKNKINILPEDIKKKIPREFYYMPVVNAGVIAGDFKCIMRFLSTITSLFDSIDNDNNNNMVCTNIVFYQLYWRKYIRSVKFRILSFRNKTIYNKLETKKQVKNKHFNIGYPLTTRFKKFENGTKAYIKHK